MSMQQKYHELLGRAGVNTATVAKNTGIAYSTLNEWRKGKTKSISLENITKIANYFKVPVTYFYDDEDLTDDQKDNLRRMHEVSAGRGRISPGNGTYCGEEGEVAKVIGDSMSPTLLDGDVVRVVETTDVEPTDLALVRINGDEMTIKHVEWTSTGMWVRAENKDVFDDVFYSVQEIATIPVQVVGKAVELVSRKL